MRRGGDCERPRGPEGWRIGASEKVQGSPGEGRPASSSWWSSSSQSCLVIIVIVIAIVIVIIFLIIKNHASAPSFGSSQLKTRAKPRMQKAHGKHIAVPYDFHSKNAKTRAEHNMGSVERRRPIEHTASFLEFPRTLNIKRLRSMIPRRSGSANRRRSHSPERRS